MKTTHKILFGNANRLEGIPSETIDLVVTSPPYPMIAMWDGVFSEQNPEVGKALETDNGTLAFDLMHQELDKVWSEAFRTLKPGGIACINIGDATRTIADNFQLYSNHSRILDSCLKIGFSSFPSIIWRKQTNAPNKFMGSGMLPPGAYVTLEHEHILILRKGGKRDFESAEDKQNRQRSAFFWEERNVWFSDVWEGLKGTGQRLDDERIRDRSAAYPFELAYRLINMFSVKGDVVFDPFLGTGTTTIAAMASGRNSVGIEIEKNFSDIIADRCENIIEYANEYNLGRISKHLEFVKERIKTKGDLKHTNEEYGFPVMTGQEKQIVFSSLKKIVRIDDGFEVQYADLSKTDLNGKPGKNNKLSEYITDQTQ